MNKFLNQKNLIFFSAFLCFFYIIFFKPISAADGNGYIDIARMFSGIKNQPIDTSDRQPFYSIILSVFCLLFKESVLLKAIIVFQFILIFNNSILLYKIFQPIIKNDAIVFFIPIAYLINLTTIFFGYMVLSETVASSFFLLLVYFIVQLPVKTNSYWYFVLVGIISSLLFLTRFSTFFILFLTPSIFCYYFVFVQKKIKPSLFILKVFLFLIPVSVSLCALSYYNLKRNNLFFLFPTTGTTSHYYSILSTIDNKNVVSSNYQTVFKLLLQKKDSIENDIFLLNKSSLLNFVGKRKAQKLTSGWRIYANAEQELFDYYGLQGKNRNRAVLSKRLSGLYKQLEKQNSMELLSFRITSILLCLRANNIITSDEFGKINFNILPTWIIIGYKMFMIILIGCFYMLSIYFVLKLIRYKSIITYFSYLAIMMFVLYFPITGFLTADVYNITRYKFLSEPLIIGLLFYYFINLRENYIKKRKPIIFND